MHLVALHEALVLLVNSGGRSGERPNVVVQIPAQVLVKHRGHEVELFIIVFLQEQKRNRNVSKKTVQPNPNFLSLYQFPALSSPVLLSSAIPGDR